MKEVPGTPRALNFPYGPFWDANKNCVYFADTGWNLVNFYSSILFIFKRIVCRLLYPSHYSLNKNLNSWIYSSGYNEQLFDYSTSSKLNLASMDSPDFTTHENRNQSSILLLVLEIWASKVRSFSIPLIQYKKWRKNRIVGRIYSTTQIPIQWIELTFLFWIVF